MADDDDEEEIEVYYVPKIPKIVIPPISFAIPTIPSKPVSPGTVIPPDAPIYSPEGIRSLNLMTAYDVSVYVNPASVKDLLLTTEYGISLPELLEITKDLSLKTEVLLQMMNWFAENNLLLRTEPVIIAHYGLLFDNFLKLKTGYTATLPEFKTYESDLLLKTENITELMAIIERAKNLGLSVEVGVIPTIGVTTNIYAGTRVEVVLTSEIINLMLSTNKLGIIHGTVLTLIEPLGGAMYPGYTITDFLDSYAEKELKLTVGGRVQHITEMYSGYTLTEFVDALIFPMIKLAVTYNVGVS